MFNPQPGKSKAKKNEFDYFHYLEKYHIDQIFVGRDKIFNYLFII